MKDRIRICKLCGKQFEYTNEHRTICSDKHYTKCCICGNDIEIRKDQTKKYLDGLPFTCTKQCATELIKRNNLEKYGVTCAMHSKQIWNKIQQQNLEKYGSVSPFGNKEIQQQNLEKRNNKTEEQKQQIIEKRKQTNLIRYGHKNYNNPQKFKNTMKERYGVNYTNESLELRTRQQQTMKQKYGYKSGYECPEIHKKMKLSMVQTNLRKYKVPYFCMTDKCKQNNKKLISKSNILFNKMLTDMGYETKLEYNLDNKYQYDIKFNNVLIEINPTYTHNSTKSPVFSYTNVGTPKDKYYHYNKTKLAQQHNFRCIHIFDWEDKDKILNMLKPKQKVYARKCQIKQVEPSIIHSFLNKYHLQNTCKGQQICLGLYYNKELIQVMTFGKPRYNKNYEYELLRLCTKFEYKVVGGAERLFKYFLNNYKPESIISYCDISKFTGDVYIRLGFKYKYTTQPNKHWSKYNKHITNNLLLQRGYDQLFGTTYGKGTNNNELMIQNGWVEVYDCGQNVYEYLT